MGQVYLARSAAGRLVAIKTIKPGLAEEEGFRTRFAQEVAAARRVSGFFTAAVVEADPDADVPWLATAYVPAPSLQQLVHACGPLPPVTVRWLAAGCAEALTSIHAAGLVHMDLKPSNVLVAADGPRVIDFGVARAVGRIGFGPGHGPVGTPAYMAPEQARDARLASPASDVFSLGATLLYAATGHPPYSGETTADVLVRLATELPDLTGLPAELTGMVAGCLHREPSQRPSSATVLARLGQFAEGPSYLPETALALIKGYQPGQSIDSDLTAPSIRPLPDKARPDMPSLWPRSWRSRRFRPKAKAGWIIAGAVLIAAVGAILGATLSGTASTPPSGQSGAGGAPGPANGPPPPPPPGGPVCDPGAKTEGPVLCVNAGRGIPGDTVTVTATGFEPRTRPALTVLFYPPPAGGSAPSASMLRVFSIAANGSVLLGPYSTPGTYEYVASLPDGQKVSAEFVVLPSGAPPP
jgi:serine/threonine protein kinase